MIVSPVSRHLVVSNVGRSVAFYRDVLGFTESPVQRDAGLPADAEVLLGPARLQLRAHRDGESREQQVLFFETDDVAAAHAALRQRGADPGAMKRVNWIKMQMFEVRDPDGHILWFGQSFAEPPIESHTPPGRGQCRQIMPAFPFDDVAAGVAHYRDVLGFSVNYHQHDLGVMDRDSVRILLVARTERHRSPASCCVYIRDADALYAELRTKGAAVGSEPISRPWGLREFTVTDPEGNELVFAQTFE